MGKNECKKFDNIIKLEDFDFNNTLIDEKSHENTIIYNISFKTLIDPKPLRIRFDKKDEFIWIYDRIRYLILFGSEKYDAINDRIRYLISLKKWYPIYFSHYFAKVHSYDSLPIEKILTLHNVIIHIKLFINKNKSHYNVRYF